MLQRQEVRSIPLPFNTVILFVFTEDRITKMHICIVTDLFILDFLSGNDICINVFKYFSTVPPSGMTLASVQEREEGKNTQINIPKHSTDFHLQRHDSGQGKKNEK